MTYLKFTYLPHLIQHVHTVLEKYYSPDEINDAMDRVQIEWADDMTLHMWWMQSVMKFHYWKMQINT